MRLMKWLGPAAALSLLISCFSVWVFIASKNITVSGVDTTGTNFGKPAYLHFVLIPFFILFSLIPRVWAKRANLGITAMNLAWAIRNYFMVTACSGGECPEKRIGLYLVLAGALLMLLASFFPDIKLKDAEKG
jgi:hypothetical protein